MHHFLEGLLANAGVSAIMALLVSFLVKRSAGYLTGEATFLAGKLTADLEAHVPEAFRGAVNAELASLAGDADAAQATVMEAAARILARVAPQFPHATITDVVNVLGETVHAFVAGLAPAPAAK